MKLLFIKWGALTQYDIETALKKLEIQYDTVQSPTDFPEDNEACRETFSKAILNYDYDAVFSINYFDVLADLCHKANVKYLAWSFDSPLVFKDISSLEYPTTYIFHFDLSDIDRLTIACKSKQIFHLPLAVDVHRFDSYHLSDNERLLYQTDISFIGQLYQSNYPMIISSLPEYYRSYFHALHDIQLSTYGIDLINADIINHDLLNKISPYLEQLKSDENLTTFSTIRSLIYKHITYSERTVLLELLGKYFDVRLYTNDKLNLPLRHITVCGPVHWKEEMPKVFKASKLNLNISLRRILSGIPQRCLDIMGSGGFLLSNNQPELQWLSQKGACVLYNSIDEAFCKAEYYLSHENERLEITATGRKIMLEKYNYENRIRFILEKADIHY